MGKKKELSEARKSLAKLKAQLKKLKMAECEVKSDCFHREPKKGGLYLRNRKNKKGTFKCKECGSKLDFRPFQGKDNAECKSYVKGVIKDYINLIDIVKLLMNKKNKKDEKYVKTLIVAAKSAYRFKKMAVVSIGDTFEPHKKGKKGKKDKKKFSKVLGGGRIFKNN